LDLGTVQVLLEAEAPRVSCRQHGVTVAAVPWARHQARFTRQFEDQAAWLATHSAKSTVSNLMRIAWRTVGHIIERVTAEAGPLADRLAGVTRIGIDEISYRKGHRYLTIVIDHDSGLLLWAAPGRDTKTVEAFFDALGPEGCERIQLVSADGAAWIEKAVNLRCPQATLCLDPFHIVSWATKALDEVRLEIWRTARQQGLEVEAKAFKGARFALCKNPENLTTRQAATLSIIAKTNEPLYRAYLLKEQLRQVLRSGAGVGMMLLDSWLVWASRSRIKPFVKLAKTIRTRRDDIRATLEHGLSNARAESANTKIRLIMRQAFGFHSPEALIALAMLGLGGLCPPLPGRA
jgi:transposase